MAAPCSGSVCLVGAGPGAPDLITAAGLDRLRRAEVVVYDALANPALLREASDAAERIDVGKRGGRHKLDQGQINQLLLDRARAGRLVVRLKGGDPYLFGRGAEEAMFLGRHGVGCEVVPGVTAGVAAPAAAGIPVTHRRVASTLTFVTGHEDPAKPRTAVDYQALAKLIAAGGTVCFYMGVRRLATICRQLAVHGAAGDTPAAMVQWGTLPRQRQVRATLETLAREVERAGLGSPAIIVVGASAGVDEPGLDVFIRRPLFGHSVLVTRMQQQASALRQKLEALGAEVLEAPTLRIVPPTNWGKVDQAVRDLRPGNIIALTSVHAVDVLADRLAALGLDGRALHGVRIAVVGGATGRKLHDRLRLAPDLVPDQAHGEALAAAVTRTFGKVGLVLLLQADLARPVLRDRLRADGWSVKQVTAYHTRIVEALPDEVLHALREHRIDWATFTSGSTVRNLVELLGEERRLLEKVRLASIGPMTSEAVREAGLKVSVEADPHNIEGLVAAVRTDGPA